jgi:S-adenosylmethionine:tRNA ribosyltransferase-isomerase
VTAVREPVGAAPGGWLRCSPALSFVLPEDLVATAPAEARGLPRDGVRMLVASASEGLAHRRAYHLPAALRPGDLLVLNTSDTLPAALSGVTAGGEVVAVHLSTVDPAAGVAPASALAARTSRWVVEVRRPSSRPGGEPSAADRTGTEIRLRGGGVLRVDRPYPGPAERSRLWTATLTSPGPVRAWLADAGEPIRYGYVSAPWPLSAYRTTYADTPGSAEMPSAGRPLTGRTFRRLRARGIRTAGLVLHCGVSSAEGEEPPRAEWYSVPESTLREIEETRAAGGRVVAVGTTVVRALESVAASGSREGWTDLVVTPARPVSTVDGMLTGWHAPAASHLDMLAALAGPDLLCASYRAALEHGYRWHEFGDVHLILP